MNDNRWKFTLEKIGVIDPLENLRNDLTGLFKAFLIIDDDKSMKNWNKDIQTLSTEFDERFREPNFSIKRPILHCALNMKKITSILDFLFSNKNADCYLSRGDFQLILEWFDRSLEIQVFEYERHRILKNGYTACLYLNLSNILHPLIFHMIIRTITEYMQNPMHVKMLSILLIFIFTYTRKHNAKLIRELGMSLMNAMKDIIDRYDNNQAIQNILKETRRKLQLQIAELGGSSKYLSEYQLDDEPSSPIDFGLKDIFNFSLPNEFKYFMVDHLASLINLESTTECLLSNLDFSQNLIWRLLNIVQKDKVPKKSLLKIGYILGKLIPFSRRKLAPTAISNVKHELVEIVIFEELNDLLYLGDRELRQMASLTLSCILKQDSFFSFAEKNCSETTFESIRILRERFGRLKRLKPPKPRKTYANIRQAEAWITEKQETWISNLANGILFWKEQKGILSFLPGMFEICPKMAESLFPFIVFEHLSDPNFKQLFEMQINNILSVSNAVELDNVRSIINTVDFLRRQNHPEALNLFENNIKWINVDFYHLAKSAGLSDMGYHALFFAEISLITDNSQKHKFLEILAGIYKKINDSDGLIGIMMLLNSSQISESLINEKL